jgi:uncharacterized protein YgiM (DUF1202 family)
VLDYQLINLLQTDFMKQLFILISLLLTSLNLIAQDKRLVITDKLNVREQPNPQAKIIGALALGDSVIITENSENKTTMSINGLQVKATWAKIEYQGKTAWVFDGGLCYEMLNPQYWQAPYPASDTLKMKKDIDKLLKDSTLTIGGNFIKLKTQNNKNIWVYECACLGENPSCKDGHKLNSLIINSQNPNILEVEMSVVAFTIKIYIDLKNGIKFNFPENQHCMLSEISPSAKYVIGVNMYSEKEQLLLFDFRSGKLLNQAFVDSFGDISHLKWLNEQAIELQSFNYETNQITKKRVLMIPAMQWKK